MRQHPSTSTTSPAITTTLRVLAIITGDTRTADQHYLGGLAIAKRFGRRRPR